MTSVRRTSVKYILICDTLTTPYISMQQLERTAVRSTSAPNMIGSTNRLRPPLTDRTYAETRLRRRGGLTHHPPRTVFDEVHKSRDFGESAS